MASNICIDVALTLLVYFSSSLASLFVASGLVITVLVLEFIAMRREMKSGLTVGDENEKGCSDKIGDDL